MSEKRMAPERLREMAGILLLALAVFLLVCLLSYHPSDPSFVRSVAGPVGIHNLCGSVGSYCADAFVRFLGVAALWLPVVLFLYSIRLFRNAGSGGLHLAGGYLGLVFSTAALLALFSGAFMFRGFFLPAGGLAGTFTTHFLKTYLNTPGAVIVLGVVFVLALMITADLSMVALIGGVFRQAASIWSRMEDFVLKKMERLEEEEKEERTLPPEPFVRAAAQEKVVPAPLVPEDRIAPTETSSRKRRSEQAAFEFIQVKDAFQVPPLTLLDQLPRRDAKIRKEQRVSNARMLEQKLADFGVEGRVVEVKPGPLITMYELEPAPGVKLNRITNLSDDIAMALRAPNIRIAPIPGKAVIGIEIPNEEREQVHLRDVLDHPAFLESRFRLPIALGVDIVGTPMVADLSRMPHLLIAGTTGSGKSVSLNSMICSILFRSTPEEVKFLMIDPKRLELPGYEGIPHLLHPVVVDPKDAALVLKWTVAEMERRYRIIGESGVKSIERYNRLMERQNVLKDRSRRREIPEEEDEARPRDDSEKTPAKNVDLGRISEENVGRKDTDAAKGPRERMPYIVIVIDELADLMIAAQRNVEESLTRLAQMARAAGIHLILATQRPSVDVITGIIKANFPTRISFQVFSKVDSRTILDQLGAEQLLGSGDMLFLPPGTSRLSRIHGAYVSEKEIERVVSFIKGQGQPHYDETILSFQPEASNGEKKEEDFDEKYDEAVELVTELGHASISLVQRYMKVGYNRAARMIERMEAEGVVGPSDGVKPRKVLARKLPQ